MGGKQLGAVNVTVTKVAETFSRYHLSTGVVIAIQDISISQGPVQDTETTADISD